MKNLAVIPARSGSKRIPGKNTRLFFGKPIISYSITVAKESGLFDEVMVSTDSERIAEIGRRYGAVVPFMRSNENANDYATLADVLIEVVNQYEKQGVTYRNVCCLLATAPLILSSRLRESYDLLNSGYFTSVFPVVEFSYPIWRGLKFDENQHLKMIWPEHLRSRSQDLPRVYYDSGSFYWIKSDSLCKEGTLLTKRGTALILPETEVQDIDTEEDWRKAEFKYMNLHKE